MRAARLRLVRAGYLPAILVHARKFPRRKSPRASVCPTNTLSEQVVHLTGVEFLRLAQTRRETRYGCAFEFEPSSERLRQLIEFIDVERQCCPFFTFILQVPTGEKAFVVEITGPAEAKPLIWAKLLADHCSHHDTRACRE